MFNFLIFLMTVLRCVTLESGPYKTHKILPRRRSGVGAAQAAVLGKLETNNYHHIPPDPRHWDTGYCEAGALYRYRQRDHWQCHRRIKADGFLYLHCCCLYKNCLENRIGHRFIHFILFVVDCMMVLVRTVLCCWWMRGEEWRVSVQ